MSEATPSSKSDLLDERRIVTELAERTIHRVLRYAEKNVAERWARYKNQTFDSFTNYIEQKSIWCRQVRGFLGEVDNSRIEDIYVPASFLRSIERLCSSNFLAAIVTKNKQTNSRSSHAAIIRGPAGSGKSLFLKYAFLQLQKLSSDRIPVLVELRALNARKLSNPDKPDVGEWTGILQSEISAYGDEISAAQIEDALKHGLFIILLDGLDEIKPVLQPVYEQLLVGLVKKYRDCPIVVTGRPMAKTLSWNDFTAYEIAPLSLPETTSLVQKSNTDASTKTRFIELINHHLEKDYAEFLGTPLLVQIMLLTFADSGKISRVRHEFYEDAFNALWNKHDARKEGFERHKYTGLQKRDFLLLLNWFAFSSYVSNDITLRSSQFSKHFIVATEISQIWVSEELFRNDLLISTSLMVEDGQYIKFCHRSFQEYFASLCIALMPDTQACSAIDLIADRYETDQVLHFLLSHSPEVIERAWILPNLKETLRRLEARPSESITSYIEEVCGKKPTGRRVRNRMVLAIVRRLYELANKTSDLKAAYDALKGMNESRTTSKLDGRRGVREAFERDRSSMLHLVKRLGDKYSKSRNASELLLTSLDRRGSS